MGELESRSATGNRAIAAIVDQHADEVSFLWLLRRGAVRAARVDSRALMSLDDRIAAHLDGLRIAGAIGQEVAGARVGDGEPGALFGPVLLALENRDAPRIAALLSIANERPPLRSATFAAFGWISPRLLQGMARELLTARWAFGRNVGLACCAMHRVNPKAALDNAMTDADPMVRARALRAAGELGRQDLRHLCMAALADEHPECRWWAAWSAVLLGDRHTALEALVRLGVTDDSRRATAFRVALQAMTIGDGHSLLQRLAATLPRQRWLIEGIGIAGDPSYVPWLVGQMAAPETARLAGEAFALITGVDLAMFELHRDRPEEAESGPTDNPADPNVDMDPDDGLPWPDPQKVETWWAANGSRFQPGTRYFVGAPVTREHCIEVLRNGYQRQRILAAHYLCLLDPGTPLFNTSAPARRQQRLLAEMT